MDRSIDELRELAKQARERAQGTQAISLLLVEQTRSLLERLRATKDVRKDKRAKSAAY